MSDEFNPEKNRDEYRERVQGMLDEKSKGQEITVDTLTLPELLSSLLIDNLYSTGRSSAD